MRFHRTAAATLAAVVVGIFIHTSRGEAPTSRPYPAIEYVHETRVEPAMKLFVTVIDLRDPDVSLRVSRGGDDPDGDGPWQTTLMPTSKIAAREGFDLAINASFFSASKAKDVEGAKTEFVGGLWSSTVGLSMTDGKAWSSPREGWPMLVVRGERTVELLAAGEKIPDDATQITSGNVWVLRDGKDAYPEKGMMAVRHPRTVVGLNKEKTKFVILTVDGRKPGVTIGMTGKDLAEEMRRLGCENAINLDGGGSSTLVLRNPETGLLEVKNTPSDGKERSVASALGVIIKGAKRATTQAAGK